MVGEELAKQGKATIHEQHEEPRTQKKSYISSPLAFLHPCHGCLTQRVAWISGLVGWVLGAGGTLFGVLACGSPILGQ